MIGSTRSRTAFALGFAALSRRCWKRSWTTPCRARATDVISRRETTTTERRWPAIGTVIASAVLYAESDKTLAGVANFLSDLKRPIETTLRAMMTTPHFGDR